MADADWNRIEMLFATAVDLPPDQRPSFLRDHCEDDARRSEVASLLAAYEDGGGFLGELRNDISAPALGPKGDAAGEHAADRLGLVGRQVAGYTVQETIGRGGMGLVYRAWDPRLERSVALKFLPPVLAATPAAEERFVGEARAAARLEHPNVATIHEIGETEEGRRFIAMTHYDGETLRTRMDRDGPFGGEMGARYVRTMAEALDQVHQAGIVHRDVKPSNVMRTVQGTLKLLDFGLARDAADMRPSAPSLRIGTPSYMSPEQADGREKGPQTDLWALGVILYEMLTGDRPFSGRRSTDVLDAIRHQEPVPLRDRRPEVPSGMASIVSRCLTKEPADRYASAEALAEDLRSLEGRTAADAPRAVAVLPFAPREAENAGPFTEGMHESILSQLSSVSDLKVVVGTSADRDGDGSFSAVADELGVRWVVTGSVWRTDDRIQIHVRLIDGQTAASVWAETYRRDLTAENLFEVQVQITRKITEALKAEVTPGERARITDRPTRNLDAYRLYAKGRAHLNRRDQEGLVHAVEHFRRAVEEDGTYALAWAGLADAMNLFPLFGPDDTDRPEIDEEQAARRALELSPDLAEAHTALGYQQGIPEGTRRLRHAVDLKPSYAQAHQWLGLKLLVAGDPQAAREHASIAVEVAPRNRAAQGFRAFQHIAEGRYQEGLAILSQETRSFEVEPDWGVDIASRFLFAALYSLGQWEKVQSLVRQRQDAVEIPKWIAQWEAKRGLVEAARGDEERAHRRTERLRARPGALYRGLLHLALGEEDAAYEAFEAVESWGYYNVVELRYFYPEILGPFRRTSRYEAFLETVEQRRAPNPTAAYREL